MLKSKLRILLSIVVVLFMLSTICFATTEPTTQNSSQEAVTTTSEASTPSTNQTSTSNEAWTNGDLYLCQDKVHVSNIVDGNAFIIGKEVTISGEIGGDLFVMAEKLTIEGGYVYSSIFACANEIIINGVIYDIYAICDTFDLKENSFIYRDLRVSADTININGKVRRNAFLFGTNINFPTENGPFIQGNLEYSANSELSFAEGIISGEVTYKNSVQPSSGKTVINYLFSFIEILLSTLVVTLLVVFFAPKFKERITSMSVKKSFACLGIGIVLPIAVIFISVLLLFTVIGVSTSMILLLSFTVLASIGFSISSIFLGNIFTKLLKKDGNSKLILFTVLACLVLWAITLIPYIGSYFSLLIAIFGIGTAFVNMVYKKENAKKEVTE